MSLQNNTFATRALLQRLGQRNNLVTQEELQQLEQSVVQPSLNLNSQINFNNDVPVDQNITDQERITQLLSLFNTPEMQSTANTMNTTNTANTANTVNTANTTNNVPIQISVPIMNNTNDSSNINDREYNDAIALQARANALATLADTGIQNAKTKAIRRAQELRNEAERQLALVNSINPTNNSTNNISNILDITDNSEENLLKKVAENTSPQSIEDILLLNAKTMQHRLEADKHELAIKHLERTQTLQVLGAIHENISATIAGLSKLAIGPILQQIANSSDTSTVNASTVLSDLITLLSKIASVASNVTSTTSTTNTSTATTASTTTTETTSSTATTSNVENTASTINVLTSEQTSPIQNNATYQNEQYSYNDIYVKQRLNYGVEFNDNEYKFGQNMITYYTDKNPDSTILGSMVNIIGYSTSANEYMPVLTLPNYEPNMFPQYGQIMYVSNVGKIPIILASNNGINGLTDGYIILYPFTINSGSTESINIDTAPINNAKSSVLLCLQESGWFTIS